MATEKVDYNDALWHACKLGNENAVQWALGLEEEEGLLCFLEESWEVKRLEGYVGGHGYDRSYSPGFGQTAVHMAALAGNQKILELLFKKRWSRTQCDANGTSPADMATIGGYPELASWIRGLQAPPSELHVELMKNENLDNDRISACMTLHPEWANRLDSFQRFPLHLAARKRANFEIVKTLIGLNPSALSHADSSNRTPLEYAWEKKCPPQTISLLLSHRLDVHFLSARQVPLEIVEKALKLRPSVTAECDPTTSTPPIHTACQFSITTTDPTFAQYMLNLVQMLYQYTPDHVEDSFQRNRLTAAMASPIEEIKTWAASLGLFYNRFRLVKPIKLFMNKYDGCEIYFAHDMKTLDANKRPRLVLMKFMLNHAYFLEELDSHMAMRAYDKFVITLLDIGGSVNSKVDHDLVKQHAQQRTDAHLGAPSWERKASQMLKTNCLITPYQGETLNDFILRETKINCKVSTFATLKRLAKSLANSLLHIHTQNYIHGDVNMSNFVRSPEDRRWRSVGLRHSVRIDGEVSQIWTTQSLGYLPPEYLNMLIGSRPPPLIADETFDVWSYGCILYELASGRPFTEMVVRGLGDDGLQAVRNFQYLDNTRVSHVTEGFKDGEDCQGIMSFLDLLKQCLVGNPKERMKSFVLVLKHPFFLDKSQVFSDPQALNPSSQMYSRDGSYGFIISIGDYENEDGGVPRKDGGLSHLRCSFEDADLMRKVFIGQGCEIVSYLVDDAATKEAVERSFSTLEKITKNKTYGKLMVYLKCRSYQPTKTSDYWLGCHGADRNFHYSTMIRASILSDIANTLDITHQFWCLDFIGSSTLLHPPFALPVNYDSEDIISSMVNSARAPMPSVLAISTVGELENQVHEREYSLFVRAFANALLMVEKQEFMGHSHNTAELFQHRKLYSAPNKLTKAIRKTMQDFLGSSGKKQTVTCGPLITSHKHIPCDGIVLFFPPNLKKLGLSTMPKTKTDATQAAAGTSLEAVRMLKEESNK